MAREAWKFGVLKALVRSPVTSQRQYCKKQLFLPTAKTQSIIVNKFFHYCSIHSYSPRIYKPTSSSVIVSLKILGQIPAFLRVFIDGIDHTFKEQKAKTKPPAKQTNPQIWGESCFNTILGIFFPPACCNSLRSQVIA